MRFFKQRGTPLEPAAGHYWQNMEAWLLPLHCSFVQTIGEKLPALVPILRPVPDLVICKKDPPDLLLFPTELQFKF